mgnify:FL=1
MQVQKTTVQKHLGIFVHIIVGSFSALSKTLLLNKHGFLNYIYLSNNGVVFKSVSLSEKNLIAL